MKTRRPHSVKDGDEDDLALDRSARVLSAELPIAVELIYIGALAAVLYLVGLALDWHLLRLLAKPWPVAAMARWALHQARERERPELKTVAYGLFFGATGDLFLEIGEDAFLLGLASFLVGHALYVRALHRETVAAHWVRGLPGLVFVGSVIALLHTRLQPPMLVAICIYGVAIVALVFRAAARVGSPLVHAEWARAGLIGAAAFAISDSIIAIDRFYTDIPGARFLIILSYWLAQGLLTASFVRGRVPVVRAEPAPAPEPAAEPSTNEAEPAPQPEDP